MMFCLFIKMLNHFPTWILIWPQLTSDILQTFLYPPLGLYSTRNNYRCPLKNKIIPFVPESFNTNILRQLFNYTITLVNSQHYNTNSKAILYSKTGFKLCFKDFWYTKIRLKISFTHKQNF